MNRCCGVCSEVKTGQHFKRQAMRHAEQLFGGHQDRCFSLGGEGHQGCHQKCAHGVLPENIDKPAAGIVFDRLVIAVAMERMLRFLCVGLVAKSAAFITAEIKQLHCVE